jgi:hypothetical protein
MDEVYIQEAACVTKSSYECEEAGVVVRTDALIGERAIVGWVLHDLILRLGKLS